MFAERLNKPFVEILRKFQTRRNLLSFRMNYTPSAIIMPFRNSCHMPLSKLVPPFTLTANLEIVCGLEIICGALQTAKLDSSRKDLTNSCFEKF